MRRMLQFFIVVCGLSAYLGQECKGTSWQPSPYHTSPISKLQTCFQRRTAKCLPKRYSQEIPVTWDMVLNDTGRYQATLSLSLCDITNYEVQLQVNEGISKEECEKATKQNFTEIHSKNSKVNVIQCEGDNCTGTPCNQTTLNFQFIFTSCYQLEITLCTHRCSRQISFKPQFLQSDYRKERIALTAPINHQFYNSKKLTITTDMKDYPWKDLLLAATPITYQLTYKYLFSSKWTLQSNSSRHEIKVHSNDQTAPTCSMDTTGNENILQFTFNNMTHFGNYTLTISIDWRNDDRCARGTLWRDLSHPCEWKKTLVLSQETMAIDPMIQLDEPEMSEETYSTLVIIVCVSVLVLALMAAIIALFTNRKSFRTGRQTKPVPPASVNAAPPSPRQQPTRVLLLYARDCPPFMELMATFRRLLEMRGGFEVADCFDPRQWGAISRDQVGWMRRHVTRANTRIVVVATKCASIQQQQRVLGDGVVRYARPHAHDGLFGYALSLMEGGGGVRSCLPPGRANVFVVRFEGFSSDGDLVSCLGTNTRFVMPAHLDQLLDNLDPSLALGATQAMMESEEVYQLREDMKQLIAYRDENTKYLENLLVVQRILNT